MERDRVISRVDVLSVTIPETADLSLDSVINICFVRGAKFASTTDIVLTQPKNGEYIIDINEILSLENIPYQVKNYKERESKLIVMRRCLSLSGEDSFEVIGTASLTQCYNNVQSMELNEIVSLSLEKGGQINIRLPEFEASRASSDSSFRESVTQPVSNDQYPQQDISPRNLSMQTTAIVNSLPMRPATVKSQDKDSLLLLATDRIAQLTEALTAAEGDIVSKKEREATLLQMLAKQTKQGSNSNGNHRSTSNGRSSSRNRNVLGDRENKENMNPNRPVKGGKGSVGGLTAEEAHAVTVTLNAQLTHKEDQIQSLRLKLDEVYKQLFMCQTDNLDLLAERDFLQLNVSELKKRPSESETATGADSRSIIITSLEAKLEAAYCTIDMMKMKLEDMSSGSIGGLDTTLNRNISDVSELFDSREVGSDMELTTSIVGANSSSPTPVSETEEVSVQTEDLSCVEASAAEELKSFEEMKAALEQSKVEIQELQELVMELQGSNDAMTTILGLRDKELEDLWVQVQSQKNVELEAQKWSDLAEDNKDLIAELESKLQEVATTNEKLQLTIEEQRALLDNKASSNGEAMAVALGETLDLSRVSVSDADTSEIQQLQQQLLDQQDRFDNSQANLVATIAIMAERIAVLLEKDKQNSHNNEQTNTPPRKTLLVKEDGRTAASLRAQLATRSEEIMSLYAKIEGVTKKLTEAQQQGKALDFEREMLLRRLAEANKKIEEKEQQVTDLREAMEVLCAGNSTASSGVGSGNANDKQELRSLTDAECALKKLKQHNQILEDARFAAVTSESESNLLVDQLRLSLFVLQGELSKEMAKTEECSGVKMELEALRLENEKLTSELSLVNETVLDLQATIQADKEVSDIRAEELSTMSDMVKSLQQRVAHLTAVESENESLKLTVSRLVRTIESLKLQVVAGAAGSTGASRSHQLPEAENCSDHVANLSAVSEVSSAADDDKTDVDVMNLSHRSDGSNHSSNHNDVNSTPTRSSSSQTSAASAAMPVGKGEDVSALKGKLHSFENVLKSQESIIRAMHAEMAAKERSYLAHTHALTAELTEVLNTLFAVPTPKVVAKTSAETQALGVGLNAVRGDVMEQKHDYTDAALMIAELAKRSDSYKARNAEAETATRNRLAKEQTVLEVRLNEGFPDEGLPSDGLLQELITTKIMYATLATESDKYVKILRKNQSRSIHSE